MPRKVFQINHSAFSQYNPESAYWAGFLAADGNLRLSKGALKQVRLYLKKSDSPHLEKFKHFLGSEHKVSLSPSYDRCSFEFTSSQIFDDLVNLYSLAPNKSLTLKFPVQIPAEFISHFVRGMFDGDGCICEAFINKNSLTASIAVTIVGTSDIVQHVFNWATSKIGPIGYNISDHAHSVGIRVFNLNTRLAMAFLSILYSGSEEATRLDRKFEIYSKISRGDRKTRILPPYDQRMPCKTNRRRGVNSKTRMMV